MRIGGSIAWPKKDGRKPELTEFIIPSSKTNTISIDDLTSHYPLWILQLTCMLLQAGRWAYLAHQNLNYSMITKNGALRILRDCSNISIQTMNI